MKNVKDGFFLFLPIIFIVILCITSFIKLYIIGVKADEMVSFFFRTLFCMVISIYIFLRSRNLEYVETLLSISDRSKFLINACNIVLFLLYLGIYWQFVYETCIVDKGNIGSVSTILAILVLSNTKYNFIKRHG